MKKIELINTLYPNGRYVLSTTHPFYHPEESEKYEKGKSTILWLRARSAHECFDILDDLNASGEYFGIGFYPYGYRPAKGFPIPEYTCKVWVNISMDYWLRNPFFECVYFLK